MVRLECQQCGAGLHWDGEQRIVKCGYCGSEYVLHPQSQRIHGESADAYVGTGEVQGIPMQTNSEFPGMCPVESFVPRGWRVCSRQANPEFYGDHAGNPFVFEAEYLSQDGSAVILLRGGNMYTDRKLSRVPLVHQIDVLGSYLRIGSPFNAEQYCDYLVQRDVAPAACRKLRVDGPDQKEQKKLQDVYNDYMRGGFASMECEWKRIVYEAADRSGKRFGVSVETRVCDGYKPMQQPMAGGFFGMFGGMNNYQHFWETQYEMIITANLDKFDIALAAGKKIFDTSKTTDDLERIRMRFMQHIQALQMQTASNIAAADMASFHRMQGVVSSAHNSIMDIMHEMNANTAAAHQTVANLHSESIRGKNTYYAVDPQTGAPAVAEADVRWDHVYQNKEHPDIFAASENYWLEPGVDFEELKRTDGHY